MRVQRLLVVSICLMGCQQGGDLLSEGANPGECSDGLDNDGDEFADCLDEGCLADPDCAAGTPTTPVVHIDPASPHPGQSLTCVVDQLSTDSDDDILEYEFSWSMENADGVESVEQELLWNEGMVYHNDTVLAGVVQGTEQWTCSLVVTDGTSTSESATDVVTVSEACGDLNCDGYPDIVFANFTGDSGQVVDSYIYYGSETGFDNGSNDTLPSAGASGVSIADLDTDGFLDIVFANHFVGTQYKIDSGIFWGSEVGYSSADRTGLPTVGAISNTIGDANADGYLDILFLNRYDGSSYDVASYLYWGSENGFSASDRLEIPLAGAGAGQIADLNNDGFPDLVMSSYYTGTSDLPASYVFWGSGSGIDTLKPTVFNTGSVEGLDVADLNNDGYLDLVFAGYGKDSNQDYGTKIYWGALGGFSEDERTNLPGHQAFDVHVRDLDGDGFLDIAIANLADPNTSSLEVESFVYWGSITGYSETNRLGLSLVSATGVESSDLDQDGYLDLVFSSLSSGVSLSTEGTIFWGGEGGYTSADVTTLDVVASFGLAISGE